MEKQILNGNTVFKLVDEEGLPLEIILLELRERNIGFNVLEFCESAKNANWTMQRTYITLKDLYIGKEHDKFNSYLVFTLSTVYKDQLSQEWKDKIGVK